MSDAQIPASDSVEHFLHEWRRERPDLDPWPVGILARIHRISSRLIRRSEQNLSPSHLTWEAFSMIVTLRRAGPPYQMRPTDLLHESLLTSGAITNRIDKVQELGLVERHTDPGDRRSIVVRLTGKGKKAADEAIASHFGLHEQLLGVLNPRERTQLAQLLSKLLASLEQSGGKPGDARGRARPAGLSQPSFQPARNGVAQQAKKRGKAAINTP